jgi:hypothetical protein
MELCLSYAKDRPGWAGEGFHVFDSFAGLSQPDERDLGSDASDADAAQIARNMAPGNFAVALDVVRENIHRRFPRVELLLVAVKVQGPGAAEEIAAGLRLADRHARADVIVVGRGGGSIEDLLDELKISRES